MRNMLWSISLLIVCSSLVACGNTTPPKQEVYKWNGGYCVEDNGRLEYVDVGSKYHYRCSICGKDYTFNEAGKYKERNNVESDSN